MAKVIAPFKLSGTLDDINFVDSQEGNYARMKREKFMTSEEFMENPIYDRIRDHGKEMGYCAIKSRQFRLLAVQFFRKSKDVSFAGRANKILLEILEEDTVNPKGQRTLEEGMKSPFLGEILLGFEGNKYRLLSKVLQTKYRYLPEERTIILADFKAREQLDWPEEATHVHLAMATANWDYKNQTFDTCYSDEIALDKESVTQTLTLATDKPKGNNLTLTYLFIGFAKMERRKYNLLHRRSNTVTLIACNRPEQPITENP